MNSSAPAYILNKEHASFPNDYLFKKIDCMFKKRRSSDVNYEPQASDYQGY